MWKKDPIHPVHYFGPFAIRKLNSSKRSLVSWVIELNGNPIGMEFKLSQAKAFVEAKTAA